MVGGLGVDRVIYTSVGDATEGDHHGAMQSVSKVENDHIMIAIDNIDYFLVESGFNKERGDQLIVIKGTAAHVGEGGLLENEVAKDLGAVPFKEPKGWTVDGSPRGGWFVHPRLLRTINGRRFMIQHHPPKNRGKIPHTAPNALSGYYRNLAMSNALKKWPIPEFVITAHYHKKFWAPITIEDIVPYAPGGQKMIDFQILPAWQACTHFVGRFMPDEVATVGMIVYVIEPDGTVTKEESMLELEKPTYKRI